MVSSSQYSLHMIFGVQASRKICDRMHVTNKSAELWESFGIFIKTHNSHISVLRSEVFVEEMKKIKKGCIKFRVILSIVFIFKEIFDELINFVEFLFGFIFRGFCKYIGCGSNFPPVLEVAEYLCFYWWLQSMRHLCYHLQKYIVRELDPSSDEVLFVPKWVDLLLFLLHRKRNLETFNSLVDHKILASVNDMHILLSLIMG